MRLNITGKAGTLIWMVLMLPGMISSQNRQETLHLKTVVIDPGHGGHDPGATVDGIQEKNIVLDVGLRLGNKIKSEYPGINVVYTRSKDIFIPLHVRAAIANRNKADLFISLHANCVSESSARGTETFTLGLYNSIENLEVAKKENAVILLEEDYTTNYEGFNPNETESYIMFENMQSEYQAQSIDLASRIQEAFTNRVRLTDRGVKQAGFLVLRQTTMPGVLVEMGFISNPAERKLLTSEAGKEKIAQSVFEAFSNYKKNIDRKSRFTAMTPGGTPDSMQADMSVVQEKEPKEERPAEKIVASPAREINKSDETLPFQGEKGSPSGSNVSAGSNSIAKTNPGVAKQPANNSKSPVQKNQETAEVKKQIWYSVQVGASTKAIEPSEKNFRGEKGIIQLKADSFYKYYSGRFDTPKKAFTEKARLQKKFPDAFVVIVENDRSRPFKNSDLR
jgi:N-acetylmuramoyl-L-alanine amidase